MADNISVFLNASLAAAVQDRTLQRVFRDALYPRLLYRMEAAPEMWPVNLGGSQSFTRKGLIRPRTRPLSASTQPTPKTYDIEQWDATAAQWGDSIDTHMPTSYVSLASTYLANIHQLGLQAGQSINRVVRDKLFNAYTSGNTTVKTGGYGGGTALPVTNLNGFTRALFQGKQQLVSATNPIAISVPSLSYTGVVTGFTSDFANDEIHSGTLTISPAIGACVGREAVLSGNRALLVQSGGSNRIDDITTSNQLRLADVRAAIAQLQADNVPPHEDGSYHMHLDPISASQLFGDNEFQRAATQSLPDYIHFRKMALAYLYGCSFYRNTEAPRNATVDQDPNFGFTTGFETQNPNGVEIHRPILTGQGPIEEKYLDESMYISNAGIQGKIGEFAITNGGVQIMAERIRLILRAPQDAFQQQTTSSWSISGDWPVPTDQTAKSSPATFKRAVVLQHG